MDFGSIDFLVVFVVRERVQGPGVKLAGFPATLAMSSSALPEECPKFDTTSFSVNILYDKMFSEEMPSVVFSGLICGRESHDHGCKVPTRGAKKVVGVCLPGDLHSQLFKPACLTTAFFSLALFFHTLLKMFAICFQRWQLSIQEDAIF
jgi:hypothetical protein